MGKRIPVPLDEETRDMIASLSRQGEDADATLRRLLRDEAWAQLDARWNHILENEAFISLDDL